jgi:hypothetical protein
MKPPDRARVGRDLRDRHCPTTQHRPFGGSRDADADADADADVNVNVNVNVNVKA